MKESAHCFNIISKICFFLLRVLGVVLSLDLIRHVYSSITQYWKRSALGLVFGLGPRISCCIDCLTTMYLWDITSSPNCLWLFNPMYMYFFYPSSDFVKYKRVLVNAVNDNCTNLLKKKRVCAWHHDILYTVSYTVSKLSMRFSKRKYNTNLHIMLFRILKLSGHIKLAQRWVFIQGNFDPLQQIEPKAGVGCFYETMYSSIIDLILFV